MKENEKWKQELLDAVMKWLEASTAAAKSEVKSNERFSKLISGDEGRDYVDLNEDGFWTDEFVNEWE